MSVKIKALQNIMGVIKKGETRIVNTRFGLLMVKEGKAQLMDFDGADIAKQVLKINQDRRAIFDKYKIPFKTSYTQFQVLGIINKFINISHGNTKEEKDE